MAPKQDRYHFCDPYLSQAVTYRLVLQCLLLGSVSEVERVTHEKNAHRPRSPAHMIRKVHDKHMK